MKMRSALHGYCSLATNIDLKMEKRMGMEEFKEKHLNVDEEAEFNKKKKQ